MQTDPLSEVTVPTEWAFAYLTYTRDLEDWLNQIGLKATELKDYQGWYVALPAGVLMIRRENNFIHIKRWQLPDNTKPGEDTYNQISYRIPQQATLQMIYQHIRTLVSKLLQEALPPPVIPP